jgi:hypothetical protein
LTFEFASQKLVQRGIQKKERDRLIVKKEKMLSGAEIV